MQRSDGRAPDQLRAITITRDFAPAATGSVLMSTGNTKVICSALVDNKIPGWMKDQSVPGGWITAEYSMLPYSTAPRKPRDSSRGRLDGRSVEIQRLIGRSLRAIVDLKALGERTLWVDCDVLQADGGTRTAAITGACVAAALACNALVRDKVLTASPLKRLVAAVSVGVVEGTPCLDLNYEEDKNASVDMNLVLTEDLEFVEIQGTGEEATFTAAELQAMLALGTDGIRQLVELQRRAIREADEAAGTQGETA